MTAKLTAAGLFAAIALSVAFASGAPAAAPVNLSCGETITVDTILAADLLDCPDNGIVIGADDITLDLDGHTVAGDSAPFEACAEGEFCDVGVLNDGHDGVTVRDGSVHGFGFGVFTGKARGNRVLEISSSENEFFGFLIAESTRSLFRGGSGSNNIAPEGDGMGIFGSDHIRVVDNSFRNNPLGLHVEDSTDNLIKGNRFSGNALFLQADRNQVQRNRFEGDAGGILVGPGSGNVIARNRVLGGADIGIEKGRGNLVVRNFVADAHRAGIRLGLAEPEELGGASNVVRRNLVIDSGSDAFLVAPRDKRSHLTRNIAVGSNDDGFDVEGRSTKLTGNRAVRNGDLGIEAARRVINGGGNVARHNGDPRQCLHMPCR